MSRDGSNIISFDGSRRASSRASQGSVESRAARVDASSRNRDRRAYGASSRVSSHAVGETFSAGRGLNYSQKIDDFSADPFARSERARFSKVTRSGRIEPIGREDGREAAFAANSRVSSRPSRASRTSQRGPSQPSSGFDLGAFSAFDDLDEQLFGTASSRRVASRATSRATVGATPRAAVEMFDPSDVEDDDHDASPNSRRSKRQRREKSKAKAKAEKMFNRQFGGDAASSVEAGSRAAVYKGEMGRSHRRAFSDLGGFDEQREGSARGGARKAQQAKTHSGAPPFVCVIGVLVCIAVAVLFLYPTAQQYYTELRTQDKLQAEYDQLSQRNAAIQSDIDRLSTDEGVQDAAREQLGWVAAGETAGVVTGLDDDDESGTSDAVYAQVDSDGVKAPDTWYSSVLDPLFGYNNN